MNNQKPEGRAKGDGITLDLHSSFFTLQGEGPFSGHRSIFLRLAGCNLQCPGCDTEYTEGRSTWQARHILLLVQNLAKENNAPGCLVVITGGEPLRQNIGPLCAMLADAGHFVQIETNGFFAPDAVTEEMARANQLALIVSPKTGKVNLVTAELAHAFKYVLAHDSVDPADGLPIEALAHPVAKGGHVARPPEGKPIYINPFDAKDENENRLNLKAAAQSSLKFGYTLGVQLHKYAELE